MQEQWDSAWAGYHMYRADNVKKVLTKMAVKSAKNVRPEHFFKDKGRGESWAVAENMLSWLHELYDSNDLIPPTSVGHSGPQF